MKHTPGPWEAVEIGHGGPIDNPMPIYEIHAGSGRAVVAEYVDEKNARLIAAAPDLLAALQDLVARYPNNVGMVAARAAIAKAEGK